MRAQQDAVKDQAETLKELEEDQRRSFERSLFVLELLTIPATSWLLATLEVKVGKKLFYEYEEGVTPIGGISWVAQPLNRVWDKYNSKIFGDMGKDVAALLSKVTGEKFLVNDYKEANAQRVVYSPDAGVFALALEQEVYKQQRQTKDSILRLTQQINNSAIFGQRVIQFLRKKNPHFDRLRYEAQLEAGQKMLNDMLNLEREKWADQWIYYANDPPSPDWRKVKRELERQIWVLWILQQHFRAEEVGLGVKIKIVTGASGGVLEATGGIGSLIKNSPIVTRLDEEFNAPVWDYILKRRPDDAQEQVKKLNEWAKHQPLTLLNSQLEGKKRVLKPVEKIW